MPRERRKVHYRGRVQGVGFRATVRHIASQFDVAGTVRNLADGRVELVVEGESSEVERFVGTIAERFRPHIQGIEQSPEVLTSEPLSNFSILF